MTGMFTVPDPQVSPHLPIALVCSTAVSTVTNISLIWDLIWTRNFTKSGAHTSAPILPLSVRSHSC
jgi:hypothetical protein